MPDLLAGVFLRPLGRNEGAHLGLGLGRIKLLVVLDLKADFAEEGEPISETQHKTDPAWVDLDLGPIRAPEVFVRAMQPRLGRRAAFRRADDRQRMVAQKHQTPPGAQQPMGFAQPYIWRAPDRRAIFRDREVEGGIGQACCLGIAFDKGDVGAMLLGQSARCGQLLIRDVNRSDLSPEFGHPACDIACATSQLDGCHARHVLGQEVQILLWQPPDPPHRIRAPKPRAALHPILGIRIPDVFVNCHIITRHGVVLTYTMGAL